MCRLADVKEGYRNRVGSCILLVIRSGGYDEEEDEQSGKISFVILRGIDSPRKHIVIQAHFRNSEKAGWPSAAIMACHFDGLTVNHAVTQFRLFCGNVD